MSVFEYIIGAVLVVFSVIIILVVLLQEGNQQNVGVISGGADTFLDKGAAKTWNMRLAKWTKVIAITFFVLVFAGMLVTKFLSKSALDKANKEDASSQVTTSSTTTSDSTTTTAASTTTTTVDEK